MTGERKKSLSGNPLKEALDAACRGLVYLSETDCPVEPVFIGRSGAYAAAGSIFLDENAPSNDDAKQAARQFFERLTAEKEWHTANDKRSVRKYRRLAKLIFDNLSDVRLIRRGRIRIEILLVGEDAEGNIAGIRTGAVET